MFYPKEKKYISPSALDNWLRSRSAFVKTYFEGEKGPETLAMTTGKQVHGLIEGGFLAVKRKYDMDEKETTFTFENGVKVLGYPDSYTKEATDGIVSFVDYKTGKANGWKEKLPTDIKMKTTAWLVWQNTGQPKTVDGAIEFIQTTWDPETKMVVPIENKQTEIVEIKYTQKELQDFTQVILKAIDDINAFYETWKDKTDTFINNEDIEEYIKLNQEISDLETKQKEVAERIQIQMEAGGMVNHKTPAGTFYTTTRKTWDYPSDMPVRYEDEDWMLHDVLDMQTAMKVAQKNYELIAEPKSESTSIGFRVAKEK